MSSGLLTPEQALTAGVITQLEVAVEVYPACKADVSVWIEQLNSGLMKHDDQEITRFLDQYPTAGFQKVARCQRSAENGQPLVTTPNSPIKSRFVAAVGSFTRQLDTRNLATASITFVQTLTYGTGRDDRDLSGVCPDVETDPGTITVQSTDYLPFCGTFHEFTAESKRTSG
jgi:hypothetical protein